MLQIPILKELPSPMSQSSPDNKEKELEVTECSHKNVNTPETSHPVTDGSALTNLEKLRAKLRTKRLESQHDSNITSLIKNLKTLICDSDLGDVQKKERARSLLETLSTTLAENKSQPSKTDMLLDVPVPPPIKRQGTFDIDLEETKQAIPDVMVSSTATFDGDNHDYEHELDLPEVGVSEIEAHCESIRCETPNVAGYDINELVEQLGKLLGQQQVVNTSNDSNDPQQNANGVSNNSNPTFIVVMPSNSLECTAQQAEDIQNISQANRAAQAFRRRSQSLSLIDKIKIVQLTAPSPVAEDQYVSPPAHIPAEIMKTPAPIVRRNSYSMGTAYTPLSRRTNNGNDNLLKSKRLSTVSNTQKPQEQQQLRMQHNNANISHIGTRPDLRRKNKTESILKSAVPLKATIPIKKIAPTFKISPTTPKKHLAKPLVTNYLDTSMQLLNKVGPISYTSTPMPMMRNANASELHANDCSITVSTSSPLKRSFAYKSRHSYLSATPQLKSVESSNSTPSNLARRTLNELRTKSPAKTRSSLMGAISKRSTTMKNVPNATTTTTSRLSTMPTNRATSRLYASGASTSSVTYTNKENKRP